MFEWGTSRSGGKIQNKETKIGIQIMFFFLYFFNFPAFWLPHSKVKKEWNSKWFLISTVPYPIIYNPASNNIMPVWRSYKTGWSYLFYWLFKKSFSSLFWKKKFTFRLITCISNFSQFHWSNENIRLNWQIY